MRIIQTIFEPTRDTESFQKEIEDEWFSRNVSLLFEEFLIESMNVSSIRKGIALIAKGGKRFGSNMVHVKLPIVGPIMAPVLHAADARP